MNIKLFIGFLSALEALWLIMLVGVIAFDKEMLSPKHMRRASIPKGLPFFGHPGLMSDPFIVSTIVAGILASYLKVWNSNDWIWSATPALVITYLLHAIWKSGDGQDCLIDAHQLMPAGRVHWVYMFVSLTVIILFFFRTPNVNHTAVIVVAVLLGFHWFLGSLKPLDLIQPSWWDRKITDDVAGWIGVLGVWLALGIRSWWILSN